MDDLRRRVNAYAGLNVDAIRQQHAAHQQQHSTVTQPDRPAASRGRRAQRGAAGSRSRARSSPASTTASTDGRHSRSRRTGFNHDATGAPAWDATPDQQQQQDGEEQQQQAGWAEVLQQAAQYVQGHSNNAVRGAEDTISQWRERSGREEQQWRSVAPFMAVSVLEQYAAPTAAACGLCGQEAECTIRCWSCNPSGGPVSVCDGCDQQVHANVHRHRRQKYDGCWEDLPYATAEGYFTFKPSKCSTEGCSGHFADLPESNLQPLDFITRDGVISMKRAAYRCSCGAVVWQGPADFLRVGAWPASLSPAHLKTIVDQALLQLWDSQKLHNPTISMVGFLKGVVDAANKLHWRQPCRDINVAAFRRAHREYKACQLDMRLQIMMINDLLCPACSEGYAGVHIDANMKLFIFKRNPPREEWRKPHYTEFFAADEDVLQALAALDLATNTERGPASNVCNGIWTAASDSKKRRQADQDYTGQCVATDARHGGPIAAANLIQTGERYGYAFHLAQLLLGYPGGLRQLHMDVMCKWAPWQARALEALLDPPLPARDDARVQQLRERCQPVTDQWQAMRKVLSHAHGTLHALACQVLIQPGWTEGCAKTLGEEGEQLFSYLSRFSHTTRNQSRAGSTDVLTEANVHFGREKNAKQAVQLVKRHVKYSKLLVSAEATLQQQLAQFVPAEQQPPVTKEQSVQVLKQQLRAMAEKEEHGRPTREKKLLKLFALVQSLQDAGALGSYLTPSSTSGELEASRIVASLESNTAVQLHNLAVQVVKEADKDRFVSMRQELAAELQLAGATEAEQVLSTLFKHAVEASIINLQNSMEAMCHNVQKQVGKRAAVAALPKEKRRHDAKVKELTQQLQVKLGQYVKLLPFGITQGRVHPTMEDLLKHKFCWADEYQRSGGSLLRMYGVSFAMKLCEADNDVRRIKEELQLLPHEMQAHLRYWQKLIGWQQQLEAALLAAMATPAAADGAGLLDDIGFKAGKHGRYQPSPQQLLRSRDAVSGAVSVVRLAQHEARRLLAEAVKQFRPYAALEAGSGGVRTETEDSDDSTHCDYIEDSEDSEAYAPGYQSAGSETD